MSRVAVAVGLALLTACSPGAGDSASGPPPPVVLIFIDTLRADRLPAYGYDGVDTPALDALAADGVVFERAWSHYPLTLPSHASIFSGLLPPEHGVRDNVGYRLAADAPHLARDLSAAGYATGAAVSSFVLRADSGLGDGFDLYDDEVPLRRRTGLGGQQRGGDATLDVALPWLRGAAVEYRDVGRPFFLFLHLYEPHSPYTPPSPFAGRYASPYDGEIAAADAVVGRLIDELRRLEVYESALVILLSDHGEGLGDHGEEEHGVLLYREALQVPLIVKLPNRPTREGEGRLAAGTRVAAPAMLADIYPTVMQVAGGSGAGPRGGPSGGEVGRAFRRRAAGMAGAVGKAGAAPAGRSLLELAREGGEPRSIYAETFYPRLHFGWSALSSLVEGDLHFIGGPRPELFDLAADPAENRNLIADRRRDYAAMRQLSDQLMTPLAPPGAEDAETRRRLTALGYLGGTARPSGPLPDPRDRLPILAELEEGMRLAARDRFAEAARLLSRVTAAEPGMVDAWEALGRAHRGAGEPDRALAAYQRALSLAPEAPQLAIGAAAALLELERPVEAAEHARLAADELPVEAAEVLVRVSLERGDTVSAAALAAAAVEAAPEAPGAHLLVAEADAAAGRLAEALGMVEAASRLAASGADPGAGPASDRGADLDGHILGLERLRGHVLARLGRSTEAVAAFEREIERFPTEPRAYSELALLHALDGRPTAAVATLRRLVATAETPRSYLAASRTLRVLGDPAGAEALRRHGAARFPASRALAGPQDAVAEG